MTKKIIVCTNYRANPNNPSCVARGSKEIMAALTLQLAEKDIPAMVEESPCLGHCEIGPNLRLIPGGDFFHEVSHDKLGKIIEKTKLFLK
jgi:NADH:ubiquinone oxidoreductase subunit E